VAATTMDDCLRTGKPSHCITNTQVNSLFYPCRVGKLSTTQFGWG